MKQTSLQGIANRAALEKDYRFRNLFMMLTTGFLWWCWRFVNKHAAPGVDGKDARQYAENLYENIGKLAEEVMRGTYKAKLVLRKYIPKANGKQRPLGLPAIADKLLQVAVTKILEAIYEQDFLACSYGYRPGTGAHKAIQDLSHELRSGRYHWIVEADIKSFFDNIDHGKLLEMLSKRIDDKPFLNLIRKWLKAGILETDGQVINPETGTPQGGIVSPILANVYLHYVLDLWFEEVVKANCFGEAYLCRYADDFVCAFRYEEDARRFYDALGYRMSAHGLELAEDKTRLILFSAALVRKSGAFDFLGFEFRWGLSQWRKAIIKRRTSRKKYRAALASFKEWCIKNCRLRMPELFTKLYAKYMGYFNYYGLRGNFKSIHDYFYWTIRMLYKYLNRRSQRKSYNWNGFASLLECFKLPKPRICHAF